MISDSEKKDRCNLLVYNRFWVVLSKMLDFYIFSKKRHNYCVKQNKYFLHLHSQKIRQ